MAKTTYRHKAGHATVGVVDASGAVHDPLVFDPECVRDDEDQAYEPTWRTLVDDGAVEPVKPSRKGA